MNNEVALVKTPTKNKKISYQFVINNFAKWLHFASEHGIMELQQTAANDETKAGSKWKLQSHKSKLQK
jgi:hypothetical protein